MKNKRTIFIIVSIVSILLTPLVAMQFTDEVNWTVSDFVVAGLLLGSTGLGFELAMRRSGSIAYRAAVGLMLMATLLLIWINLAVGIIGSENNPANSVYVAVIGIELLGAVVARLKARAMARAMFLTALAQLSAPVIALIIWKYQVNSTEAFLGVLGVFVLSSFFAVLFGGSALLFKRASVAP